MKKFLKCTRGAVAVFLAIIIIPMVTLTSAFVDSGKVILARALAESAGDLALNTVLTNFDKELNEYFGLIASAQSTEEAFTMARQFFVDSMLSQANTAENTSGLRGQASKWGSNKSYGDFLGLKVSSGDVAVTALENGSLVNPAILKKQIVEFNKYRAPANALIDLYNWIVDSKDQMEELDDIADMTDKKNTFYEEESDLVNALKKLRDYLIIYDENGINSSYIDKVSNLIKLSGEIDNFYADLHTKIIYDYINVYNGSTEHVKSSWEVKMSDPTPTTYPTKKIKIKTEAANEDGTTSETTKSKDVYHIEKALDECCKACRDYKTAETKFLKMLTANGLYNNGDVYNSKKDSIYDVQYWALAEKTMKDNHKDVEDFKSAYYNMILKWKTLITCYSKFNELDDEWKIEYYYSIHGSSDLYDNYSMPNYRYTNLSGTSKGVAYAGETKAYADHYQGLKDFMTEAKKSDGVKEYLALAERLNKIYENIIKGNDEYTKNKNIKRATADAKIADYSTKLSQHYEKLEDAIKDIQLSLDDIQGNGWFTTSLYKKLEDYNTSFDDWDTAVGNLSDSESDAVKLDREETAKKKSDGRDVDPNDALLDKITNNDVTVLENRLEAIKTLLQNCQKGIKELKYCGKSIKDLKSVDDAISAVKSQAKSAGVSYQSFYINDINGLENVRKFETVESSTIKVTEANNPDLTVNEPKLRKDIYDFFAQQEVNRDGAYTEDEANDLKDKFEKNSGKNEDDSKKEEKETDAKTSSSASKKEICDQENLPSGLSSSDDFSSSSSDLTDVSKTVGDIFADLATDFRDDLLVTDYIMRMFSHDTFEKELLMECAKDGGDIPKTKTEWEKMKSPYAQQLTDNMNKTSWNYNKNLRNIAINDKNCFSYMNEIEYILYGGSNSSNKTAAFCYIYAIRFACDLSPVIAYGWSNGTVCSLAASISAATLGVLPEPLVKVLICLGLTCAEAAFDMSYIKDGFGIKFFKTKEDLFCNFSGEDVSSTESENGANGIGFGINKDGAYLQYSDYLHFFLIMKMMGSGETDVLKRTGDVIQLNMRMHNKDYLLEKSQIYFNLSAKVSIRPLMLSQPINASSNNPFSDVSEIVSFTYNMSRGY